MATTKQEIRNPKFEILNKFEIQKSQAQKNFCRLNRSGRATSRFSPLACYCVLLSPFLPFSLFPFFPSFEFVGYLVLRISDWELARKADAANPTPWHGTPQSSVPDPSFQQLNRLRLLGGRQADWVVAESTGSQLWG